MSPPARSRCARPTPPTGSRPSASSRSYSGTGSLGLLVLYHETRREWPAEELELAAAFADQMASAIENARLYEATVDLAARLRAIQDLGRPAQPDPGRPGHRRGDRGRGPQPDRPRQHPGLPRRPRDAGRASRSPSRACSWASRTSSIDLLRCKVGEGLTGWVAEHNEALVDRRCRDRSAAGPDRPDRRTRVDAPRPDGVRRPGRRGHRPGQARPRPLLGRPRGDAVDLRRPRRPGVRQRRQRGAGPARSSASSSISSPASAGCSRSTRRCCRRSTRTPSSR